MKMLDKTSNQTEFRTQMRSRKVATARHCRRGPACAYPAIRGGWPTGARKQSGLALPSFAAASDRLTIARVHAKIQVCPIAASIWAQAIPVGGAGLRAT